MSRRSADSARPMTVKAMVLAAGLGTRLRPLTDDRPKALVEVAGRPMLDLTLARLRTFGVQDVIVNVFHFADKIADYLDENNNFGMRIVLSREESLLDTGGGLQKAAWFFTEDEEEGSPQGGKPFILHNVDILSNFDLRQMLQAHRQHGNLATLAAQQRATSRPLLFDRQGRLLGRAGAATNGDRENKMALAFAGIHILSPRIFACMKDEAPEAEGAFSIISTYARLAELGENISAFRDDSAYWRDLGKPASVLQAAEDMQQSPGLTPPPWPRRKAQT